MIHICQIIALCIWSIPLIAFAPATWRTLRHKDRDVLSAAVFLTALAILVFNMRALWFRTDRLAVDPASIPFWLAAYLLLTSAGLLLTFASAEARHGANN